ncbi:Concanavalin A-like lectin/glucanase, subgroup [Artemisia annua]|uniref:non-specific serine/threonine protein kinase n=1 Tax=Artemisia annua TaxID=35608 RepID=A0A2U1LUQ7_ARTAN|nr:Concanavalin A-like lectin/glucanase, subgroup [Artemisia annua]
MKYVREIMVEREKHQIPPLHASRGLQMTHRFKQQEMKIQAWENHEKRISVLDIHFLLSFLITVNGVAAAGMPGPCPMFNLSTESTASPVTYAIGAPQRNSACAQTSNTIPGSGRRTRTQRGTTLGYSLLALVCYIDLHFIWPHCRTSGLHNMKMRFHFVSIGNNINAVMISPMKVTYIAPQDNNVAKVVISLLQEIQEMEQRATMLQLVEKFKVKKQESSLCVIVVFILLFPLTYTDATCNPLDRESLLPLATKFPGLNWSVVVDCCSWDGISCDDEGSRVVELSIPNRGLREEFPLSLQNLTSLSLLNLSYNFFSGPLSNGFFSSFNNLKIIDLSYNRLYGNLPDTLSSTLQSLNCSSNFFNGTIQTTFFNSPLTLIDLQISNNSFTGTIPSSICTSSPNLVTLDISFNKFSGNIPQGFGNCSKLQILSAGFNNLTGRLPIDIDGARSMQQLSLPGNYLMGEIGERITNLTNLTSLSLFGNLFSGSIPRNIGKLSFLERLELHINILNGTIPLSLINCTKLQLLNLRVNSLVGMLADYDFSNFSRLSIIDLGQNEFEGVLPRTLFSCKSLTAIRLSSNRLRGEFWTDVVELPSLSFLALSNNSFTNITNALNMLSSYTKLTTLLISKNFFNESLPDGGIYGFLDLKIMVLGGCKLFGQIPTWFRMLKNLQVIDLSQNNIIGTIPGWLQTLPSLFYLDLSNNGITGGFPLELTRHPALASQQVLDHVNSSYLELPVFVAPQNHSYLQIPGAISNITTLEKLDLSHNNLSGEIPASLKSLYFMSSLNVAYNNLQGRIPTGGQFDTFLNQTYEGNPGLCGPPSQNPCRNQLTITKSSSIHKKDSNKKMIVGLILGICFGLGITFTCLAFWILSKRSISPRGNTEIHHMDMVSFNTTPAVEVPKDTDGVILFPDNTRDIKHLTIEDILKATDNFSEANIIGCGGRGMVYRAILANGKKLAVKKISGDARLISKEFEAEVEALSTAQHKNLASLRGYCINDGCQLLIYSYMENGSLEYWLHEKTDGASTLDWPIRLKIVQGASCGLAYLHQVCIVHRDMKSSNILLDKKFEAYIADFGFSRMIQPYCTHVTTELVGTLGYIPPEYSQAWIATFRGDIYSFGVVMLELLSGRRPMEIFRPKESRELVKWVQQLKIEGKQNEVFDPALSGKGFEVEMLQVLDVACKCVNENPSKRPSVNEVVDWLHSVGSKQP